MKAVTCVELGPADRLELQDVPDPIAGPGEVVIDVHAAALNFPDTLIIQGKYQFQPELPFTPGGEAAGIVSAVGEGVADVTVGSRVLSVGIHGAFAEKWAVPATTLMPMPEHLTYVEAAAFGLTYGTSYYALKQRANLQAGETLLVLGAAGGVGASAVELGKAMGATVIAAASTEEKLAFATDMGADHTINYVDGDLRSGIKELTDGRGVDVVYDPVGGDYSEAALRSMAWNGRFLVIGFASGTIPSIPLNLALLKGVSVVGVFWGSWVGKDPAASAENFAELFGMVAEERLHPRVTDVYPLADYEAAYGALTGRRARGKVVLTV
ncbi:MAG: NADPH:quinone oxidoreductase family protein [Acidimicrobiia bacterium]|nr:NADPH:quinone oxidoreductase family protein [Acidimicrobiia bacterium]